MRIEPAELADVKIIEPTVLTDARGSFFEAWQLERHARAGIPPLFVQDNLSRSLRGVLRGLHLQHPNGQGKLVMVVAGSILDVAVDVRLGSPSFGRHTAVELSDANHRQLWIPRGFAHGFYVLSASADVFYKCDAPYSQKDEKSIRWDDPAIGVRWPGASPILSPRDAAAPLLADVADLPAYDAA